MVTDAMQSVVMLAASLVLWWTVWSYIGGWDGIDALDLKQAEAGLSEQMLHVGGREPKPDVPRLAHCCRLDDPADGLLRRQSFPGDANASGAQRVGCEDVRSACRDGDGGGDVVQRHAWASWVGPCIRRSNMSTRSFRS